MNLVLKPFTLKKLLWWMQMKFTLSVDIFCEEELPDYVQQECGVELGGIVAMGFIKPGTWVGENDTERRNNLESSTWWNDGLGASPQTHWVVQNTRGSKPIGTPIEEDGYGMNAVERTGDDQEITFEALGVVDNRDFWGSMNRRPGWGFVAIIKNNSTERVGFYFQDASVYADINIPQSVKERANISGSVKLASDMSLGLPFTAPSSVFTP